MAKVRITKVPQYKKGAPVQLNSRISQLNDSIMRNANEPYNYAIADKDVDSMFYFNPQGQPIAGEPIITGASRNNVDRGMSMKDYFKKTGTNNHEQYFDYLKSTGNQTTPSGHFTVSGVRENTADNPDMLGNIYNNLFRTQRADEIYNSRLQDYGAQQKMLLLQNDQGVPQSKAIHGTGRPNRVEALATPGSDRHMSNGCINVGGETVCFDQLGKGSSVYVMPEKGPQSVPKKYLAPLQQDAYANLGASPIQGMTIPQGIEPTPDRTTDTRLATKKYGGPTMKRKVRITATPDMAWGGPLPNTGTNINGGGPNQVIDTRWSNYGYNSPFAYAEDPFTTKSSLPEVPDEEAKIKVEKQEQIRGDFDGTGKQALMGVNTGSHASGNDQGVNVPDGSFVYSDTPALQIKNKEVLARFGGTVASTPAQLAKKFPLQKYTVTPDDDKLTSETKNMMYVNNSNKLDELAQIQEAMKTDKNISRAMRNKKAKFGGKLPAYQPGGGVGPYAGSYGFQDEVGPYPPSGIPGPYSTDVEQPGAVGPYASGYGPMTISYPGYKSPKAMGLKRDKDYGSNFMPFDADVAAQQGYPANMPQTTRDYQAWQIGQDPNLMLRKNWTDAKFGPRTTMWQNPNPRELPTATGELTGEITGPEQQMMQERAIPEGIGKLNKVRVRHPWKLPGLKGLKGVGLTAENLGDLALGLKAMNLQKFQPWEPPVQTVTPEAVYMDPTRELAANSEQAAMAYQSAQATGNSQAARAAGSAFQGQALANAGNILGKYNNANVEIGNKANQVSAGITNERMEKERERQKSLHQDRFNANRLYQSELNQVSDELVKRAYTKEDAARHRAFINQTSPYYKLDRNNFPVFSSQDAADKWYKESRGIGQGGVDNSTIGTYNKAYDYAYKNASPNLSDEEKRDLADDYARASSNMTGRTKSQTKAGNTTTTTSEPTVAKKKKGGRIKKENPFY